jgi:hypothetical protein
VGRRTGILTHSNAERSASMSIYQRTCKCCGKHIQGRPDKLFCNRNCKTRFRRSPYVSYKKMICEICDFTAKHRCQLDVHHMDGNHMNNSPENLQTVCANCHRLITHHQKPNTMNYKYRKGEDFSSP